MLMLIFLFMFMFIMSLLKKIMFKYKCYYFYVFVALLLFFQLYIWKINNKITRENLNMKKKKHFIIQIMNTLGWLFLETRVLVDS